MEYLSLPHVLTFVGFACISYGAFLYSPILGFILSGILLVMAAIIAAKSDQ